VKLFTWLHNFRCVATCFNYYAENNLGFVHLGYILMLLRCYL
jgi:hypothetical protein